MKYSTSTNVYQFPLPDIEQPLPAKKPTKAWRYLISESLAFNRDVENAIRIQKPQEAIVPQWISKLIVSGQCSAIYVEDLRLSQRDEREIKALCSVYRVEVVGVSANCEHPTNVVSGPW